MGKLTAEQANQLPSDFDKILRVYDDFGDVQTEDFKTWWLKRGMKLCGHQGAKPHVESVGALQSDRENATTLTEGIQDFLTSAWLEQGQQETLVVAIPVGLSKNSINKQLSLLLDQASSGEKKIVPKQPKYSLVGKRHDHEMLFRYMSVLLLRAAAPDKALWRIGVRANASDTYSPELEFDANVIPNQNTYDRMMLTTLTSRAFLRARMISENAARGLFPTYIKCEHAIDFDLAAMLIRHIERMKLIKLTK